MPIFEIEAGGKTYEVDAPTQAAALAGFAKFPKGDAPKVGIGEAISNAWDKPPSGPSLIGFAKGIWEDLIKPPGQAYRGEIDPLSDESIGRSLRAATVATPLSPAAGIFGAASGIGGGVGARNMRQGPPAPSPSGALSPAAQAAVDQARAMGAEVRIGADVLPPVATPVATPAINAAIEAGQRQNIDLPKFLASETETVPRIAAATANVPYAGEPIVTSAKKVVEQIGAGKQAIADELGVGSAEVGGGAAKDALANWISTESQKPVSDAYKTVDSLINPEIRAPLSNTADEVAKIMAERAASKIPGKSKAVDTVLEAIQAPEGMNYAGAKGLRSFLGEQTPQELIAQGIKPVEAKRLYGPLTRDLQSIVAASGPEATTAFQQANAITRLTANQRRNLTKIVGAKGDAPAEAVFSRLVAMSGSKSSADIQRLILAKSAMGEGAWKEVSSAVLSRMGKDARGEFSADRFVTAYGNLAPKAKVALFSPNHRSALADLFQISAHVQDKITKFSSPSGTPRGMLGAGLIGGLWAEPISTIGGLLGGRKFAEFISQPAVVRKIASHIHAQNRVLSAPNDPLLLQKLQTSARTLGAALGLPPQAILNPNQT